MEAIVFIILQIFFETRAFFKIGGKVGWGIFAQVMRLDQSRVSENI